MTAAEIRAFNAGVLAVIDLARRSANALEAGTKRPLAVGFGVEALRALADAAGDLIQLTKPADGAPGREPAA